MSVIGSGGGSPRDGLDPGRQEQSGTGPANPPGRSALRYRLDTRSGFLARMLDRLSTETLPDAPAGRRPLAALASRETDDPAVALLDAWAGIADILAFYQERIANEGYVKTAVERRSILELARLAGQELGPGVAASAFLEFTVEDAPGAPASVLVPRGTQVQSIPGQDELPQTFETREDFVAHALWNGLVPRQGRRQELAGARELFLAGADLGLSPGDPLLVLATPATGQAGPLPALVRVAVLAVDADRQLTRVTLEEPLSLDLDAESLKRAGIEIFALRDKTAFFGHNAPRWGSLPRAEVQKADPYGVPEASDWDAGRTVWTDSAGTPYGGGDGPDLYLDRKLENVVAGSWVVVTGRDLVLGVPRWQAYRILGHAEATLADYAIVGESTGLTLAPAATGGTLDHPDFDVRASTAHLGSEPLTLAERPIEAPYPSQEEDGGLAVMVLDRRVEGLRSGQSLVLHGELVAGGTAARLVQLQQVGEDPDAPGHTRLVFQQPLPPFLFARPTVTLHGNVVLATHGETVREVLGSGDASRVHQRFALKRPPLTYVSAPRPGGRVSTLEVRVDGVLWREVETLFGEDGRSQAYMVEIAADGTAAVRFGDGVHGARLPTGVENLTAVYRSGVGLPGMVAADTLQLLVTRPLGIREVTNPLPATGGAPPDPVERARADAPVLARTRGRIVSLADFEDFARTFAGIAKVEARPLGGVHLTVAGEAGAPVPRGSELYSNLVQAIQAARLPGPPITITSYERLPFEVVAQLVLDPRHRAEEVFARARATLAGAFAFERRSLGQPVYASDVIAVLQGVRGVVAVDLEALHVAGTPARLVSPLPALPARPAGGQVLPAQLLVLESGGIDLRTKTP